MLSLRSQYITW